MSNSNFEGNVDLKTHTLYPYEAIRIRDLNLDDPSKNFVLFDYGNEFNIDINIDNSSFINADFSVSSVSNETFFLTMEKRTLKKALYGTIQITIEE